MPKTKPSDLAINGGPKAVTEPIPYVGFGVNELGEEEKQYVNDVLNRKAVFRWQDAKNSYVMRFEEGFAKKAGTKHALAVSSGTAALVTGLTALGVGPGDEVIVPGYTYIASASAVILVGAVPVIAEIDDTLTLDPKDCERKITPYTKTIMPVHMRGIPCDMDKIMRLAKKHKIAVIEDASQCDGGTFNGKRVGAIGHIGCFSLQASKTITSGEGGVVITNDDNLYARAAIAHDSGIAFWRKLSEELTKKVTLQAFAGQGYRMNELAGAVAFAQLHKLDKIVAVCRQRKKDLMRDIAGAPGLKPMRVPDPDGECAYSANFLFDSADEAKRFAQALSAEGVRVHTIHNEGFPDRHIYKYWDYVLHKTPISPGRDPWRDPRYKGNVTYSEDMCPQTMSVLTRTVAVPFNQRMTRAHSRLIAKAIKKVAEGLYG